MGYILNHAIVVTSWSEEHIERAHAQAQSVFPVVTEVVPVLVNGGGSFLIPPDGSKEGWSDSDEGDERRAAYIAWLRAQRKNHLWVDWVEIAFGGDADDAFITASVHDATLEPDAGEQG